MDLAEVKEWMRITEGKGGIGRRDLMEWLISEVDNLTISLTAANQEKVNALSALAQIKESITLAAAPMGITGEPGEVVAKMGAEIKRLVAEMQCPVCEGEGSYYWEGIITKVECTECGGTGRTQLLTAREQGRREMREEAAEAVETSVYSGNAQLKQMLAAQVRALSPKGEVCEWTLDTVARGKGGEDAKV